MQRILFPAAQHCGNHARASAAIDNSHNPERFQLRGIGYQAMSNYNKSQQQRGKVGASMPLMREKHE
jgi:hypothetical protein